MKLLSLNEGVKLARTSLSPLNIDYAHAVLIHKETAEKRVEYTAPSDGLLLCSGYGENITNSKIYFNIGAIKYQSQGVEQNDICLCLPLSKGTEVFIYTYLVKENYGLYFIPIK